MKHISILVPKTGQRLPNQITLYQRSMTIGAESNAAVAIRLRIDTVRFDTLAKPVFCEAATSNGDARIATKYITQMVALIDNQIVGDL